MTSSLIDIVAAVALAEVPHVGSANHGPHGPAWDDAVHREAVAVGYVEIIKPQANLQSSESTWWVRITAAGHRFLAESGRLPPELVKSPWPSARRPSRKVR
jgi:hypothetical protein